ncbi:hypothetical protein [Sorangium sp. So ce1153]|uniref:hypothetical protein n=1 Tax=Sorangium sp. So ce1153 TaxID=3133333 RepID=UPI003F60E7BE
MLRFRRPKPPKGFAKEVDAARRVVARAIAAGQVPEFHPSWRKGEYKREFVAAQHGKCGYCETYLLNHPPAMEHYAPKGEVEALANEGVEADGIYGVRDRDTQQISRTGYHWLAYDWNNWLLACERCNTGWKRSLFPVREDPHPCPPTPDQPYTALLLSPFGVDDPVEHLEFSVLGEVIPRDGSEYGEATIRTLGFSRRESLRNVRQGFAADATQHARGLEQALVDGKLDIAQIHTEELISLGGEERLHAGMVRSIVLSRLGLHWSQMEELAEKLAASTPPHTKDPRLAVRRRARGQKQ